jgi:hypothetical protein
MRSNMKELLISVSSVVCLGIKRELACCQRKRRSSSTVKNSGPLHLGCLKIVATMYLLMTKKIKRSLHFSPASFGWKLTPETTSMGKIINARHHEEEGTKAVPQVVQDVLAEAVNNLQVVDGPAVGITDDQVTKATVETTKRVRWARKAKQPKLGPMKVPSILDCLREDGSLCAELKGDAEKTAAIFLKKKTQVLGKR